MANYTRQNSVTGATETYSFDDNVTTVVNGLPPSSMPAGCIVLMIDAPCPSGFSEVAGLAGKFPLGTTNAAGNVGTTGGADNITPAGTNSAPTFTGSALGTHEHGAGTLVPSAHSGTAVADHAAHTHTYTQVVDHVHTLATGTGSTGNFSQVIGTVDTSSGGTGGTPTQTALGTRSGNPVGSAGATGTTANPSATLTHAVTQPADHTMGGTSEAISGGTPAGTVTAPTFTGTSFDNRPAFARVIFCRKD